MRQIVASSLVLVIAACTSREPPASPRPHDERPASATSEPPRPAEQSPTSAPPTSAEQPADAPSADAPAPPSADRPPAASLLGRSRADVEAALGRPRGESSGWVDHGELAARYRRGRCVGLRRQVPEDMDCQTAVESLGFRPVGFPLRRADGCEWPGISERHRLAPGVAARYDAVTRRLEVWLRED